MMELFLPGRIIRNDVSLSFHDILISDQTVETDRPARVKLAGADADLRAEPVAETVRKAR